MNAFLSPDDDHGGELRDCFEHQSGQLRPRFWHQHVPCARVSGFPISPLSLSEKFGFFSRIFLVMNEKEILILPL